MKGKKLLAGILSVVMALCTMAISVFAESSTMSLSEFVAAVEAGNGTFDGQGITVEWSPIDGCRNNTHPTECIKNLPSAVAETPNRVFISLAQFALFSGTDNLNISNVNFKYTAGDVQICANSSAQYTGSFTAAETATAELHLYNTGNVTFTGCGFDNVTLTPWGVNADADRIVTVTECSFSNNANSYGIKDVNASNVIIKNNTFQTKNGVMLSRNTAKNVEISGNSFNCLEIGDLIQVASSYKFDETSAMSVTGNISESNTGVFRLENNDIKNLTFKDNTIPSGASLTSYKSSYGATVDESGNFSVQDWTAKDNNVKVGSNYFKTLASALTYVYKNGPYDSAVTIECKSGADVGAMTHGHVEDDLIIIGNDAYVSSGERDFELDTYTFSRATGAQTKGSTDYLQKNVTVKVNNLNGIAAWGERHSNYTVDLEFTNCRNMQRVYFSGTSGTNNIKLTNCSFSRSLTSDSSYPQGDKTSVYSNNPGTIVINGCDFTGIPAAVNMNNKSNGKQDITITGCTFTNCASAANAADWNDFAAPIRFVTQNGASTDVKVSDCTVKYSDGNTNVGNGDILLGDGREGKASTEKITLDISGTAGEVQIQAPGKGKVRGETLTESDSKTIAMESAAVAKIGGKTFSTMKEAIEAAQDGDKIIVIGKAAVKSDVSLQNKKITFAGDPSDGADELTFIDGVKGEWNNAYYADNSDFIFEDLTLTWNMNGGYQGFVRPNRIVYNRCVIIGELYLAGNSQIFNSCDFRQELSSVYNVWTYGALKSEFNNCNFYSHGKSVLVYKESSSSYSDATPFDIKINGCKFKAEEAVTGKAAVEVDSSLYPFTVSIDNSTSEGFAAGSTSGNSLYNMKKMNTDLTVTDKTGLTVNGEEIDLKPIREQTIWVFDTDAGFYKTADGKKYGMMRFMFSVVPNGTVTEAGIKYVNADNLSAEATAENTVSASGEIKAFQGDIVGISTDVAGGGAYYALAYVKTEKGEFWSNPVRCSVDWTQYFTDYTPGGAN